MRNIHKLALKTVAQQTLMFCLRYDFRIHVWKMFSDTEKIGLSEKGLAMDTFMRKKLDEYLQIYQNVMDKLERFDKRIEELSGRATYVE